MCCRHQVLQPLAHGLLLSALFISALLIGAVQADEQKSADKPTAPAVASENKTEADKSGEKNKTPAENEAGAEPAGNRPSASTQIDPAAELLQRLNPENLQAVAGMIEQDWSDRPEWAEMAVAIMRGQANRNGTGWWKATDKKHGWTWLKRKYDKNADNIVERSEFETSDASFDLFFRRLDRDLDGKVGAPDFDVSIFQGTTPAAMKARMMDFLFLRLDGDSNGQVSKEEITGFFDRADREKSSFLTSEDLLEALQDEPQKLGDSDGPTSAQMLSMFLSGQLGWFEEGPKVGDPAPDFTLASHDGKQSITLSEFRDKKPVVLIFGSFT